MKKTLLLTLMLALTGMAGSMTALAQVPEPSGKWTFDNAEDLMAPSVGGLAMTPCVIPANKSIEVSNVSDAGIVRADDEEYGITAIAVPKASALKVLRAEGAEASSTYTILLDFKVPDSQPFNGLLQMAEGNDNDGDLFTNKGKIGIGSMGYAGKIEADEWYRAVLTYNVVDGNGNVSLYLNGSKVVQGGVNQRHVMEPFGFYVLCDEDGEKLDVTYLAQVAYWETPLTDEEVAELGNAIPPHQHNYVDFICTVCGVFQADYLTPNADGFYEIATAKDLSWFEMKVNLGDLTANAILTDDIDMDDMLEGGETEINWTPIGDWGNTRGTGSAGYQGHFDGQGHSITNLNATSKQNFFGLFGVISSNSIIENFSIYGTYNTRFQYAGGVAAYARDINPTIRNVHSFVDINNTSAGGRQGGILGGAHVDNANYKCTIANCIYSGTLDGNDAGGSGNYGGMVGYANSNANNIVEISNCLFDGEVVNLNATPGGCTFGGIVGYCNSAQVFVNNCLSIGTVNAAEGKYGQFFGAINGNNSTFSSCCYKGEAVNGAKSSGQVKGDTPVMVDDEQLASGEACWLLNAESFVNPAWHQVLGKQDCPLPYGDEGVVYPTPDGYDCIDFNNFAGFLRAILSAETARIEDEDFAAYHIYVEAYKETLQSWQDISSFEEFFEAYEAAAGQRNALRASAAKYAEYRQACETAFAYIEDNRLAGEKTDILLAYLEDEIEAGNETYPNGSYLYIMENGNLDNDGIDAEIVFVNDMLYTAIATDGIAPGDDIARFFTNLTFANGFEGWTVENEGGPAMQTGGVAEVMPIVHGYGKGAFSVSQTAEGLPNGIYMTTTNALFAANDNSFSTLHAGQVFINNTMNFVMAPCEDLIPVEEAVDKVNCLIDEDTEYEGEYGHGYVPFSRQGASYAFSSGRYVNYCAAEVTDGTLTVGVRNPGTGLAKDWLPFCNMHVTYLGTPDEANTYLTDVLAAYCDRARVILNFMWDESDVMAYPNMSNALKEELESAIGNAEKATDGQSKMELINTFSSLFNQVQDCRQAYIEMAQAANKLADYINTLVDIGLFSSDSDECKQWEEEIYSALNHYISGDVTAEEARAIVETLNNCDLKLADIDGVYQLASAKDLVLFQMMVNEGNDKVDAVLTADIDFAELIPEGETELLWTPIGFWGSQSRAYRGHFDGQGHTIRNFNATANQDFFGLFGVAANDAVIENFYIDGNITNDSYNYIGVIGYARGNSVNVRGIHSSVNFTSTFERQQTRIIGGVVGFLDNNSTLNIDRCTYSGTLTVTDSGNDDGLYGGILGYVYNNANAHLSITNCLFDGVVTNLAPQTECASGGIAGWIGANVPYTLSNCLSVGTVSTASNACGQFVGGFKSAKGTWSNNYYQGSAINGNVGGAVAVSATLVTDEQLASGEVCYKLNGDQSNIAWYQTLAEDSYPVLFKDHLQVWLDNGTYSNDDPDGIVDIRQAEPGQNGINKQGSTIVNLAGQQIANGKLPKGIYIVGGKKIIRN